MTLRVAVIVGPTACGKTRLGVQVAHRLGAEIVSADSRQVYRGLDLGAGKDLHEYAAVSPPVKYHLIDVVQPEELYTLFRFQCDCYRLLRESEREHRGRPGRVSLVIVGGTGLYVEAVIRQFPIADVPEDPALRRRLMREPREALVDELRRQDPEILARTDVSSTKRVVRGLEIARHRRRHGAVQYSEPHGIDVEYAVFGVRADRHWLRRRISQRVDERLRLGMVEEVQGLLDRGVPRERLHMLGLEYREIAAHLCGEATSEEMVQTLKLRIGQLAKRQETYFRGLARRGVPVTWVEPGDAETVLRRLEDRGTCPQSRSSRILDR